jgi:hypothetical protein
MTTWTFANALADFPLDIDSHLCIWHVDQVNWQNIANSPAIGPRMLNTI